MKKKLTLILMWSLIISCASTQETLEEFENELGYSYPSEFKNYIEQLDDDKVNVINIMHDSFQIISPNNISMLHDEAFTKLGLVNNIDEYISRELGGNNLRSLPFARSLTGDRYGFLFFIYEEGKDENMVIYHRDTDRLYYGAVPIGNFANYFYNSPKELKGSRINLTNEQSALNFLETYPKIEILDFISDEVSQKESIEEKEGLVTSIDFSIVKEGTIIQITHDLKTKNQSTIYQVKYLDKNHQHQYSYENNLSYNHFSLIQYYVIESLVRFKNLEVVKSEKFDRILDDKSITDIITTGLEDKK